MSPITRNYFIDMQNCIGNEHLGIVCKAQIMEGLIQ